MPTNNPNGPDQTNTPLLTEVLFMSQRLAESYPPTPDEAIISITDPGCPAADLKAGWQALLRLSFDDFDPVASPQESGENLIEIQEHHATQIAHFVQQVAETAVTIVVHCKYGQARSAGVAKAIAEFYGIDLLEESRYANNYVYERVLRALRRGRLPT